MKLSRVQELKAQVEEAELDLEYQRGRLESVTSILRRLPRAKPLKSEVEKLAAQVVASERELAHLRGELSKAAMKLPEEILERVKGQSAQVLILRYCAGKSFEEIGKEMHYSKSSVFRLHQQGVKQFNSADNCIQRDNG